VPLGLFGFSKIVHQVFGTSADAAALLRGTLMALGTLTALVGAAMAWRQRHLKRLLAFSTISHVGIMLVGLASLTAVGLAGQLAYVVGHGLVKGALFMLAGVLLATRASVDELDLRGLGRDLWPAGLASAIAGLLLAGLPIGLLHGANHLIEEAVSPVWGGGVVIATTVSAAITGAAVLRATARVYLGLGPDPGEEADAPSAAEQERANRPLPLMLAPVILLLGLALLPAGWVEEAAPYAHMFAGATATLTVSAAPGPVSLFLPWSATGGALLLAAWSLGRDRWPKAVTRGTDALVRPVFLGLDVLHSGLIGDYVAWMMVGLAALALSSGLP
jgi:multicomponent Na+:H+ antiporter subunit D